MRDNLARMRGLAVAITAIAAGSAISGTSALATVSATAVATAPVATFSAAITTVAGLLTALTRIAAVWPTVATLASFGLATATPHLLVALRHSGFARKAHPALFIDTEALDPNLIPEFDDVFGLFDPEVSQFANMNQSVFAGQEFHKSAKIFDRDHFAAVDLADFGFGSHAGDGVPGNLHSLGGNRVNIDRAIVFDVDLAAGFFD